MNYIYCVKSESFPSHAITPWGIASINIHIRNPENYRFGTNFDFFFITIFTSLSSHSIYKGAKMNLNGIRSVTIDLCDPKNWISHYYWSLLDSCICHPFPHPLPGVLMRHLDVIRSIIIHLKTLKTVDWSVISVKNRQDSRKDI